MKSSIRRNLIKTIATLSAMSFVPKLSAQSLVKTPKATEGPFYPTPAMRFKDADNDLVKIMGKVVEAGGEVIHLSGTVFDSSGNPADNARVEIWQCDVNGHYLHTSDNNAPQDTAFQGFGHVVTDHTGAYAFRTIMPVSYPGRTPHIHVKVFHGNNELTTQFYIEGDAQNQRDGTFNRLSEDEAKSVSMSFVSENNVPSAVVDIYL